MSDQEIVKKVIALDAAAFEILYERYADAAYSLAWHILGSQSAAENACYSVYVSLWRSASTYAPELGSVRFWILATTRDYAINALRATQANTEQQLYDQDTIERNLDKPRPSGSRGPSGLLDELPSRQKMMLELAFLSGQSYIEIANFLAVPLETVKEEMRLSLENLRSKMLLAEELA